MLLSAALLAELVYVLAGGGQPVGMREVGPKEVGLALYGPYLLGVELASLLLLSGLIGACHLGRRLCRAGAKGGIDMTTPLANVLILAAVLFVLGLVGVLARRSIIFMLLSIEIMLNAAGLAFVAAGSRWGQPDGQVMFIFIISMAAAEVSVGLALVLQMHHRLKTLNTDEARTMRG